MAPSLSKVSDSALWFGLGFFLALSVPTISYSLQTIRTLTRINNSHDHKNVPVPSTTQQSTRLPSHATTQESSISLSSLQTLILSPNIGIRLSATEILCHRFCRNTWAREKLLSDIQSTNPETRHRAELVARLLCDVGGFDGVEERMGRGGWRVMEGNTAESVPQVVTEQQETEADLRRRRREAVVIHEGNMPFENHQGNMPFENHQGNTPGQVREGQRPFEDHEGHTGFQSQTGFEHNGGFERNMGFDRNTGFERNMGWDSHMESGRNTGFGRNTDSERNTGFERNTGVQASSGFDSNLNFWGHLSWGSRENHAPDDDWDGYVAFVDEDGNTMGDDLLYVPHDFNAHHESAWESPFAESMLSAAEAQFHALSSARSQAR